MNSCLTKYIVIVLTLAGSLMSCDDRDSKKPDRFTQISAPQSAPLVHIFYNPDDSLSLATLQNIEKTLIYSKLPFSTSSVTDTAANIPQSARATFLTTNPADSLSGFSSQLQRKVHRGHNVIITRPLWKDQLMFMMGFRPDIPPEYDTTATGIVFNKEIFPGFQGLSDSLNTSTSHNGFYRRAFKPDVEVLASAIRPVNYPVIVRHNIGNGSVYLYNSNVFSNENFSSVLFSNLLNTLPGIPYPVSNVSTIFLDDFPAPYYNIKEQPIAQEYDITQAEFVHDIWWPDMKRLADSLDITYTTALVFNYNQKVIPPFDFNEWKVGKVLDSGDTVSVSHFLTKDVLQSRHELGFHGYNHTSLALEPWQQKRYMVLSTEAARRMWFIQGYGDYPTTYVPPHNLIDSTGIKSVKEGMPSLEILSSITDGAVVEGGEREYGPDPYKPSLYNYPRSTNGYYTTNYSVLSQHSQLLVTGIWNHFVHPDDVYDIEEGGKYIDFRPRNPKLLGWKSDLGRGKMGMFPMFKQRILQTQKWYPLLDFISAQAGVSSVRATLEARYQRTISSDSVKITRTGGPEVSGTNKQHHWFIYIPEQKDNQMESIIKKKSSQFAKVTFWDGYLYQFSTKNSSLTLPSLDTSHGTLQELTIEELDAEIKNFKRIRNLTQNPDLEYTQQSLDSLKELYSRASSDQHLNDIIKVSVGISQTGEAISLLEKKVLGQPEWDEMQLQRLLIFYGWEGKSSAPWELLEERWAYYPDTTTLELKNILVEQYGWPNLETQRRWLRREYDVNPDNTKINRRVAWEFATDSTWDISKEASLKLIEKFPRSDTLYAFTLQRSFWYDSTNITRELINDFPNHSYPQLRPFAGELAYIYANHNDYSTAIQWANRAFTFDPNTKLYWHQMQGDSTYFREKALETLRKHPKAESLRSYIGLNLLYQGFSEDAYTILRPFLEDHQQDSIDAQIHAEMGYLPFEERMDVYRTYPSFFNDTLRSQLHEHYARSNNYSINPYGSYRTDNFDNTVAEGGVKASLTGDRGTHSISISDIFVGSRVNQQIQKGQLYKIVYDYSNSLLEEQLQAHIGGGIQYRNEQLFPSVAAGLSYSTERSFTSSELNYKPVYTNSAIASGIKEVTAEIYREQPWIENYLRTGISARARYFTDQVFHYEAGLTSFIFPFNYNNLNISPVAYISYGDATVSRNSGIPYFTPANLLTTGGGFSASYSLPANNTDIQIQTRANRDKDTPLFGSLNISASTPITEHLSLQLGGYFSTSEVYRSNQFNLSLQFNIPKKLPAPDPNPYRSSTYHTSDIKAKLPTEKNGEFNILGQIVVSDTMALTSLYNHKVNFNKVDGSESGSVLTYYDGSFFIEDLSPGTYQLWAEPKDAMAMALQDTIIVKSIPYLPEKTRTGIELTLLPQQEEDQLESAETTYSIVINYTDSLSRAIALVKRYRKQFGRNISLHYDQTRNLIQLRTDSFNNKKEADSLLNQIHSQFEGTFSHISADTSSNTSPITYRFQFDLFKRRESARQLASQLEARINQYEITISIDPILGVYVVGTKEMNDWHNSDAKLRELQHQLGAGEVIRKTQPSNLF